MVVSIDVALFSWSDSNTHISEPSSFTSFHHRRPTKILPETFFTNQKSNALSITTKINVRAWETPNKFNTIKRMIAIILNSKVKKTTAG